MNAEDTNSMGSPLRSGDFNPELTPAQFESEFWGRVLDRQPYYLDVLRRQAESLARASRYVELLPVDRRVVELLPANPVVHYNLACTLARLASIDESLTMLEKAVSLGYDDFEHIESDPDLDCLRNEPGYLAIIQSAR